MKYVPLLWMMLLAGCSGGSDAMQKQLDEMKDQVTRLRASNLALQDRVDGLEEQATVQAARDEIPGAAEADDRPQLEVVRVVPPSEPEQAALEPSAPVDDHRPMIKRNARGEIEVMDEKDAPGAGGAARRMR
jgi:outer membrane murein-binding lipoprotein Lpp